MGLGLGCGVVVRGFPTAVRRRRRKRFSPLFSPFQWQLVNIWRSIDACSHCIAFYFISSCFFHCFYFPSSFSFSADDISFNLSNDRQTNRQTNLALKLIRWWSSEWDWTSDPIRSDQIESLTGVDQKKRQAMTVAAKNGGANWVKLFHFITRWQIMK